MTFADGSESVVAQTLEMGKRKYTLAELTVEEGQTSANPAVLKEYFRLFLSERLLLCARRRNGNGRTGSRTPCWNYTQGEDSIYVFGDINDGPGIP